MNKKILFITPGLSRGGAETQLTRVAAYLQDQQKDVLIIALNPINDFSSFLEERRIPVLFLKQWKKHPFSNLVALFRSIDKFRPDVVIGFMFIAIIFARLLKIKYKFHLISSVRNSVISNKWRKAFKLTSKLDDLVVYNSKTSKLNFEKQELVNKKGIVINNAILIPPRVAELEPKANGNLFTWVTMAHFRPSKDYVTLFKAISLIKEVKFRINILGHLQGQEWPFEMVKELGIEDKVQILGFKHNAIDYLKEADAFVLSSFWEGSPNAMLEAMAHLKPVIGSSVNGIEELLSEARCGFLFPQGDAEELSLRMMEIMTMSEEDRKALGEQGRAYIEANFSELQILEQWREIVG